MKALFGSLFEKRENQISFLDGLRALAIIMVVASHSRNDFVFAGGIEKPSTIFAGVDYLWTGVDLFFVLSGFLIGKILFQEIKKTGSIELGSFLLKRGFRIWPLYFFVCLVSLLRLAFIGQLPGFSTIAPDLLFLTNYFPEHLAFGSWSLSIEEQFYILASSAVFLTRKWGSQSGEKIALFLVSLLIIAPISRFLTWRVYSTTGMSEFDIEWNIIHSFITTHYDGIVIGLLLAAFEVFTDVCAPLRKHFSRLLIVSLLFLGFLVFLKPLVFTYSFASVLFGSTLWYGLHHRMSKITSLLSWPVFQVISRLSYGMYLWYRFPLWRIARFVMTYFKNVPPLAQYLMIFGIAFVTAVLCASITYVLIEQPFLAMRSRLFQRREQLAYAPS